MDSGYWNLGGSETPATSLQVPRARLFAEAISDGCLNFVTLVGCRHHEGDGCVWEDVVIEVDIERPQHVKHGIRPVERVAIRFSLEDDLCPAVLAVRKDFPQVPHINLSLSEFPRSLCLYDQRWEEIVLRWSPVRFVERVRSWLSATSMGTLHQSDQHLEPLFLGGVGIVILSPDVLPKNMDKNPVELGAERFVVMMGQEKCDSFVVLAFVVKPQTHGIIHHHPRHLAELDEFLRVGGVRLVDALRAKVVEWDSVEIRQRNLLLTISFPLRREEGSEVEVTNVWGFLTRATVEEVGIGIGVWEKAPGSPGVIGHVLQRDPGADGRSIAIDLLSPCFNLSRASAAEMNGFAADSRKIVAIGVGALGGQVVDLLARGGFGRWTLVDEDILLPHNVARHVLPSLMVGSLKALSVACLISQYYPESEPAEGIAADVLRPGERSEGVRQRIEQADLVLDLAASPAVSRFLAHEAPGSARRVACFFNSRGTDLVVLAEDEERNIRLDNLEMQYYRAVAGLPKLASHLSPPEGQIRYARSCRDVTSTMPNDLVALHSGIAARVVRDVASRTQATIGVWMADPNWLTVEHVEVPVSSVYGKQIGEWILVVDSYVVTRLANFRSEKLPNETGGVLIGSHDFKRRIVYVVETIPSPLDSDEWPSMYIRGKSGLMEEVNRIRITTDGWLDYVGEWHSHPDECKCLPSKEDRLFFSWLSEHMKDAGLPTLMGIVGERGRVSWFLNEISHKSSWESDSRV